MGSTSN
jgi:hypothetical protein